MCSARLLNKILTFTFIIGYFISYYISRPEMLKLPIIWLITFAICFVLYFIFSMINIGFIFPLVNLISETIFKVSIIKDDIPGASLPSGPRWEDLSSEEKRRIIENQEYEAREKKRQRNLDSAVGRYKQASFELARDSSDVNAQRRKEDAFADMMRYR